MLEDQPDRKFYAYELSKVNTRWGWLGDSGSRRARTLAQKRLCFHDIEEKTGYARYWHKAEEFSFPRLRPEVLQAKIQGKLM